MTPTDPISAPPVQAPNSGQPVVEFIRTQRQTAAYLFLGLSAAFLVLTIFLAAKAFRTPESAKTDETKQNEKAETPPELPKPEVANPKRPSYMVGWIGALFGFLITVSVGVFLQIMPPKPTLAQQLRESRVVLLTAGGLLGLAVILFGAFFFYLWSDSLTNWLDKGEKKEMMWVVIPLLMVAGGAGLVFASAQPARAEERNDNTLRRLVYGSNFAVTVLLLFVVLLIGNIVVAKHFPNKLDTTETGFYTLAESTKNFLSKLPEPATLYVIMPESGEREVNDIRQFAYTAQDASDGKLNVKFVSPVSNKTELARLQEKYPRISRDSLGILIAVGEDGKRSSFVPVDELFETDPRSGRFKGFAGEGKVMKELRFLADNEQKPVVYFTQSNGELAITNTPGVESVGGSANLLKGYLEKAYMEVKPLVFPIKNPTVPDDAAVVIVAEPQSPFSPEAVDALRRYMSNPAKKGKLIVLAGAAPGPNDKGMVKTGLEGLLAEFNVRLGEKFIYSLPTQQNPSYKSTIAAFTQGSGSNPINQAFGPGRGFRFLMPREVAPLQSNPTFKAETLMATPRGQITWLEDDPVQLDERYVRDLFENEAIAVRKQLSEGSRSVAVVVSEGGGMNPHGGPTAGTGRLLVVGNSIIFSDRVAQQAKGNPISFDMIGVGIDWLRDRPALTTTVEAKAYKEYQPPEPATISDLRLIYMPLGLGMLLIIGLGTGVWVIRRK
jgi:hypothetical protein